MPSGGRLLIETQTVQLDDEGCRSRLEASPGLHAILIVKDTGVGIERTTMNRIFDPFFTTKKPGEGTGLGLAMVYGIIKNHGGHIICESQLGKGTIFRIYLRAHQVEGASDVNISGEYPALGTGTILLVDDEEFVRELGQRILERAGYHVIAVTNGLEGVAAYQENRDRILLVILDLIMPVLDGYQCLEEILGINPAAKVIIASGRFPDEFYRDSAGGRVRGFVRKPYKLKELLTTVQNVLLSD